MLRKSSLFIILILLLVVIPFAQAQDECSSNGTLEGFETTFVNDIGGDGTLYWIGYDCVEQQPRPIIDGESFELNTFDGHEFIFRDENGDLIFNVTVNVEMSNEEILISRLVAESTAEEVEQIPSITTLAGTLDTGVIGQYRFEAEEGVLYGISLTSSDFDTLLRLYDADGVEIVVNDDGGEGLNSLLTFTAPSNGMYTIGVDSFAEEASGDYILSLTHTTTVVLNFVVDGVSDNAFDVQEGIMYFVSVNSEDFDTVVSISDDNGTEIISDDDGGEGSNSLAVFTAASTGTYNIAVSSFSEESSGEYNILIGTFEELPMAEGNAPIPSIATVTGTLMSNAEMNQFVFEGEEGVLYAISLTSLDFDTLVRVYDADGVEIAINDDGGEGLNSLLTFTAPSNGMYTIGIDSYVDEASGDYILSLTHTTTVILNFVVDGVSDNDFDVQEGVMYFVSVNSENFDTVVSISDDNGTEIVSDDDGGEGSNSLAVFTAASTGTYNIAVSSFSEESSGEYDILIGTFGN